MAFHITISANPDTIWVPGSEYENVRDWIVRQGLNPAIDYVFFQDLGKDKVAYYIRDNNKRVMFKLAWGGLCPG